jgi:hypothetical protein
MPPVFEGEVGGWRRITCKYTFGWIMVVGKEDAYLAGFCVVILEFCFAGIANVN